MAGGDGERAAETASDKARAAWLGRVAAFDAAAEWRTWSREDTRRTLLRDLNRILHTTPPLLLQKFDGFGEADLQRRARDLMCHMGLRERCTAAMPAEQALLRCAAVLRALDELLLEGAERIGDEAPDCWLTADGEHWVIPTPRPVMREGGPRDGQAYGRRGLLHHRVIPTRVDDVDIVVDMHPDVTDPEGDSAPRTIGCGIFPGFTLQYEKVGDKGFVVTATDCDGGLADTLQRHCAKAREDGCDVIVWPELTIHPDHVRTLSASLADAPLRTALPPIVVAGSWHVEEGGAVRNVAPVLDGRGGELEPFGKSRLFSFGGLTEAVEADGRVHVLATDRDLVAFAICKDFCDKANGVPLAELDVDLVLVPSMGRRNTMTAHRDAADHMKVRFGTRTVVAQQTFPRSAREPDGYLLRAPAEPRETEPKALAGGSGLTTFQVEQRAERFSPPQA